MLNNRLGRGLLLVGVLTTVLGGCGEGDPKDIELSEMNQPENATRLLESLSPDERDLLARYVALNARSLDYKLTVGEALQLATDQRDAREMEHLAAAESEMRAQEERRKAVAAERDARMAELLDRPIAALGNDRVQVIHELQRMVMMSDEALNGPPPKLLSELPLLERYMRLGLAPSDATLGAALEDIRREPVEMEARLREAELAANRQAELDLLLDGTYVGGYVRQPEMRAHAARLLPPDDFALLDSYLPAGQSVSSTDALWTITLRQALQNSRDGKSAR